MIQTMEKRRLGRTDMDVSILGFGGAEIGFDNNSVSNATELLNAALDAGLNTIDTASAYLDSEQLIGQALKSRRKSFYLFTKCGATDGFRSSDWTKAGLQKQIESSLRALQTDYLDLIQLHSCDEETLRRGEAIDTLQRIKQKGYARYIGYSGDNEAAKVAIQTGAFDTFQTSISIVDQYAIENTLPLARERQMGVIAKRPIGNAAWKTGQKPKNSYHHAYWERFQKLRYDFLQKPLPEAVSIALRFTLSQPGVHVAIVGSQQPGRWVENARLIDAGPLANSEIQKIKEQWAAAGGAQWLGEV